MWLYFNSKGQLITSLEHGNPARVGSTAFEIFATVEGLNENNIANYMATIKLRKPDLTGSSYPTLLMENASATFYKREDEGDTGEFENNQTYYGFLFNFGSFNDNEEEEILLDTDGLWEAIINVIKDNYDVQGVATFNVAGHGTEQASSISYDIITNQLVQNINKRALKEQTIINIANTSVDVSAYENGQMFYSVEDRKLYRKENDELVSQVDSSFTVDGSLSSTSQNPVQNRVVTQQLQNIREVIAGKNKTYILGCDWNIAYLKANADEVRNSEGTDISHDIDLGNYDDYITYNEGFNTQEQVVNNIHDTDYIILRDDTNCYYLLEYQWMLESFLKLGDVIYILEADVPDRWYAGDYNLYALESVSKLYKHVITGFTYQSYSFGLVVVNNSSQKFTNNSVSLLLFGESVLSVYFFLTTDTSRKYKVLDLWPIGSPNMQVGNQIKVVHLSTQDLTTIVSTNWTIGTIEDTISLY